VLDREALREAIEHVTHLAGLQGFWTFTPEQHWSSLEAGAQIVTLLTMAKIGFQPSNGRAVLNHGRDRPRPDSVSGLANGALYAFVGLAFSLVSRSTGLINFAQGDLTMLGRMLAAALSESGVPLLIAVPLASVGCAAVGGGFYCFAIRPSTRATMSQLIIITVGLSILIRGAVTSLWGTDPKQEPPLTPGAPIALGGVSILPQQLWLIGVLVLIAVGTAWFFRRTTLGLARRASAANPLWR
jgi:branched-subunit amino acid ABC-type transport system permease component